MQNFAYVFGGAFFLQIMTGFIVAKSPASPYLEVVGTGAALVIYAILMRAVPNILVRLEPHFWLVGTLLGIFSSQMMKLTFP